MSSEVRVYPNPEPRLNPVCPEHELCLVVTLKYLGEAVSVHVVPDDFSGGYAWLVEECKEAAETIRNVRTEELQRTNAARAARAEGAEA